MKLIKYTCTLLMCAVLALLPLTGCDRGEQSSSSESSSESSQSSEPEEIRIPDYPVEVFDTEIAEQPQRVVSLSPALTEMLFALGYGDRVYGVSDYCDYPSEAGGITNCGSPLRPNLKELEDLAPDYLLTETPLQLSDYWAIHDMGIEIIEITAPTDFEGAFELYYNICLLMDGVTTGDENGTLLTDGYRQQLDLLSEKIMEDPLAYEYSAVWIIEPETPIIVQSGTFYHEVMDILGLDNAASDGLAEDTAPDLVLYADTTLPEALSTSERFGAWEAVTQNKLVEIPLSPFERYSPRMFDLLTILADEIYTTASAEPAASEAASE